MKKNIILFIFIIGLAGFIGCKKDETKAYLNEQITAPVFSSGFTNGQTIVLNKDDAANEISFGWSGSNYGFPAGVNYTLQVDKEGNNFATPIDLGNTNTEKVIKITTEFLNKKLITFQADPKNLVAQAVEFRIKSEIGQSVPVVYSPKIKVTITPYSMTFPPIYMCGAATGGWNWDSEVEVRSTGAGTYETVAYFLNNESFRFFAQDNWDPISYNYLFFTTVTNLLVNANDGDKNFKVVGATGYYKISVDLNTKTVEMVSVPEPELYMCGAATGGWNWNPGTPVKMTWKKDNYFEATTNFTGNETFRFFAQADWSPTSYNYLFFAGGTISNLFENADDGDKNFRFKGTTGSYKITVHLTDKVITMTAAK